MSSANSNNETNLEKDSKILQDAINEINYGVAELRDLRMDFTQKTEDALDNLNMQPQQAISFDNSTVNRNNNKQFRTIDNTYPLEVRSPTFPYYKEKGRLKASK